MRKLRQVLLVEADASGDQLVCTKIERAVAQLSCGAQSFGRYEVVEDDGVRVKVTIIGHAQEIDGYGGYGAERDAPRVSGYVSAVPMGLPPPGGLSDRETKAIDFELLYAIKATRLPIERPDLFERFQRLLGVEPLPTR